MKIKLIQINDWDGFCKTILRSAYSTWAVYMAKKSNVPVPECADADLEAVMPMERVEELAFDLSTGSSTGVRVMSTENLSHLLGEVAAELAQGIMQTMIEAGKAELGVDKDGNMVLLFHEGGET